MNQVKMKEKLLTPFNNNLRGARSLSREIGIPYLLTFK